MGIFKFSKSYKMGGKKKGGADGDDDAMKSVDLFFKLYGAKCKKLGIPQCA